MTFDPPVPLPNPFLQDGYLVSLADLSDALKNASATLYLLADLFGGDNEKYPILDSEAAWRARWKR